MRRIATLLSLLLFASASPATVIGPGGRFVDMAIGADGFPVIAYSLYIDGAPPGGGLQVAKCGDAACNTFVTRPVDTQGVVAFHVSIAVGPDGLPAISYFQADGNSLRFVKCGDAACSTGNVARTLDGGGGVNRGQYSSIAVTSDNRPFISYFDSNAYRVRYAACNDPTCATGSTQQAGTQNQNLGEYTSMAMGAGDIPQFTYQNAQSLGLNLYRCSNGPACNSGIGNFFVQVNACSGTGSYNSLAFGSDGLPVVTYYNTCIGALNLARCTDAFCAGGNIITTIDGNGSSPFVGKHSALAIAGNGNPLVSYWDESNQVVKLLRCGDPACSANNVKTTIGPAGDDNGTGRITALVVSAGGIPVVAYGNVTTDQLNVVAILPDAMFSDSFED